MTKAMMVSVDRLTKGIHDSSQVMASLAAKVDQLAAICDAVIESLRNGGKVLTAGNGGSAAEALHLTEELLGRFKTNRMPLASMALAADCTTLTCIANDFGFESIFSRQVEALGKPGDVLILFSTSGNSKNLIAAMEAARAKGVKTICLLGRDGGAMANRSDHEIIVETTATERIQEAHQVLMHLILDAVEEAFKV